MKPVYITILTIVDYSVTRDAKFDIDLEGFCVYGSNYEKTTARIHIKLSNWWVFKSNIKLIKFCWNDPQPVLDEGLFKTICGLWQRCILAEYSCFYCVADFLTH